MGICTNSSSGGDSEGLAHDLHSVGRTYVLAMFLVVTFFLHTMNRMMQLPCKNNFGEGSISNRNTIQLSHACFAFQKDYEMSEWRQIWHNTNNEDFG